MEIKNLYSEFTDITKDTSECIIEFIEYAKDCIRRANPNYDFNFFVYRKKPYKGRNKHIEFQYVDAIELESPPDKVTEIAMFNQFTNGCTQRFDFKLAK